MMKRRAFVAAGASLLAVAGLAPARLIAASDATLDIRVVGFDGGLSQVKFRALLNQTFYFRDDTLGTIFVRLVEVRGRKRPVRPEQFSLFFRGPALPQLPAGVYEVEHYLAGKTLLYLEPAHGPGEPALYRADVSLLK
jgi:hypothetical protein